MEDLTCTIVDNIIIGPPAPDLINQDLVKAFYKSLTEAGDTILVTNAQTGETKTANQILKDVNNLAINLKNRFNIKSGDIVAIAIENNINISAIYTAIWVLGAVFAPINPLYAHDEILHIVGIIKPKIVICGEKSWKMIENVRLEVTSIENVVLIDDCGELSFKQLLENVNDEIEWRVPVDLNSTAILLCSSGTTGLPKCVELTFINIQRAAQLVRSFENKGNLNLRKITAGFVPQYHGFGILISIDALLRKDHLITFPRFEIGHFLASCEKFKINTIFLVPPVLVLLAKHPLVEKTDLSSVCELRCGAAPIKLSLITEALNRISKNAQFFEGYGLTEATVVSVMSRSSLKPGPTGSVGEIGFGMQCRVVDLETNETLGANQEGEICFKGDCIMKGYKDNPEATAASFDQDGWFHTGDVGFYDENGWIFVGERIKELIKYNAMQVSPSELEALILKHPAVQDVAVWGKPDEAAGQLPMAFVVAENKVTGEEIQQFVAEHVSAHKKLRGGVVFVNEIPKSASGKILRRFLYKLLPL